MEHPNPFTSKVFDKLAQLKQWQCEQHERLIREQEEQRRILLEEQNNRMQNLGIANIREEMSEETIEHGADELNGVSVLSSDSDSSSGHHTVTLNTTAEDTFDRPYESSDDGEKHPKMFYNIETEDREPHAGAASAVQENGKRKFTFLRRGEGLSRYRMTPRDIMAQNRRIQACKGKSGSKVVNNVKQGKTKPDNVPAKKIVKTTNGKAKSANVQAKPLEVKLPGKQRGGNRAPVITAEGKMMVPRSASQPALSLDVNAPSTSRQYPPSMPSTSTSRQYPPQVPSTSRQPTSAPQPSGSNVSNWVTSSAQYMTSSHQNIPTSAPNLVPNSTQFIPMQPPPVPTPMSNFAIPVTLSHIISDVPSVSHYVSNLASNMMAVPSSVTDTTREDTSVPISRSQVRVNAPYWLSKIEEVGNWVPDSVQFLQPEELNGNSWGAVLSQTQAGSALNVVAARDTSRGVEQRELRTFERLERIAADSSFCSSSSLVTRFMDAGYLSSSVQSTPQVTPMKQQPPRELQLPQTSTPNPTIENAKALIERLAAIKFSDPPYGLESTDVITLDLRPLEGQQTPENQDDLEEVGSTTPHVRFQDNPQIHELEVESEAWSESEEDSSEETESESGQTSSETEDTLQTNQRDDEKVVIGSLVHTRLEQLEQELLKVQQQQIALAKQREELGNERQQLATILSQTEEEKRRLEAERKNLVVTARKKQRQEKEEVEQLKKQVEELKSGWKDREARWAASQASQRAQLRQLSLDNKELSMQIHLLKTAQAKKVQFARQGKPPPEVKIIKRTLDGKVTSTTTSLNKKTNGPQLSSYFVTNPATPTLSAMTYGNANTSEDSYHVVNSPNSSPSGKVSSLINPTFEESLRGVSKPDIDTLIANYKRLFGEDPTPYSSLLLNSPGGITTAYNALFNNNDESMLQSTTNEATVGDFESSRRYNEATSRVNQNVGSVQENQVFAQTSGRHLPNTQEQNLLENQALHPNLRQNTVPQQTNTQVQNSVDNQVLAQISGRPYYMSQQTNSQDQNLVQNQVQNSRQQANAQNSSENRVLAQISTRPNNISQQPNIQRQNLIENQILAQNAMRPNYLIQQPNYQLQNSVENQAMNQNHMTQRPNIQTQNSVAVQTSFLFGQVQAANYETVGNNFLNPVAPTAAPQNVRFDPPATQNSAFSDLQQVIRNSDCIRINAENLGYVKHGSAITGVSASGDAERAYAPRNSELTSMEIRNLGFNQPKIQSSDEMILRGIVRYPLVQNESSGDQEYTATSGITASGDIQPSGYVRTSVNNVPEVPTAAAPQNPGIFTSSKKTQSTGFYKISTQFSEISIVSAVEESSYQVQQSAQVVEKEVNAEVMCQDNKIGATEDDENGGASCVVYLEDGSRRLWFPNGNTMTINADNTTMTLYFYNGDIQETVKLENQIRYYYAAKQVWETNYLDGTTVFTCPDGTHHKIYPSGRREIKWADDSVMTVFEDGKRETNFPNGTKRIQEVDGTVHTYFPDGSKETQTTDKCTRLNQPNGTVVTRYPSGLEETKYTNGRTVVKDSTGKLLLDSAQQ